MIAMVIPAFLHSTVGAEIAGAVASIVICCILFFLYCIIADWWEARHTPVDNEARYDDAREQEQWEQWCRNSYPTLPPGLMGQGLVQSQQRYFNLSSANASRSVNDLSSNTVLTQNDKATTETGLEWPMTGIQGAMANSVHTSRYINELHELIKDLQEQVDELNEDK